MAAIRGAFAVESGAEITSEANPGSADAGKFKAMREAGFNRISIGVQSFDDGLLAALDRVHSAAEAERAILTARAAGFGNISLDLMFALPRQTAALWRASLERAVSLGTEHLSLYALTLEPGTRFERLHAGGRLTLPGDEAEASMYEECIALLANRGYEQYEVSNFARAGFRCRHNQVYWRNGDCLGVGPGAVSHMGMRRWKRERLPARYVRKVAQGAELAVESEELGPEATLGETMMLGIRMLEGLSLAELGARYGVDVEMRYAGEIEALTRRGLVSVAAGRLRLTRNGLLLADTVAVEFLAA
jgi:oxygen-independent coproporphyrinogen-3 oxidase